MNDFNMNFKLGNLGFYFDVGYLPTELNTEKMTLSMKHATKIDPSFQTMEFIESLKFGTPKYGPLRFWNSVRLFFLFLPNLEIASLLHEPELINPLGYRTTSFVTRPLQISF